MQIGAHCILYNRDTAVLTPKVLAKLIKTGLLWLEVSLKMLFGLGLFLDLVK